MNTIIPSRFTERVREFYIRNFLNTGGFQTEDLFEIPHELSNLQLEQINDLFKQTFGEKFSTDPSTKKLLNHIAKYVVVMYSDKNFPSGDVQHDEPWRHIGHPDTSFEPDPNESRHYFNHHLKVGRYDKEVYLVMQGTTITKHRRPYVQNAAVRLGTLGEEGSTDWIRVAALTAYANFFGLYKGGVSSLTWDFLNTYTFEDNRFYSPKSLVCQDLLRSVRAAVSDCTVMDFNSTTMEIKDLDTLAHFKLCLDIDYLDSVTINKRLQPNDVVFTIHITKINSSLEDYDMIVNELGLGPVTYTKAEIDIASVDMFELVDRISGDLVYLQKRLKKVLNLTKLFK